MVTTVTNEGRVVLESPVYMDAWEEIEPVLTSYLSVSFAYQNTLCTPLAVLGFCEFLITP